MMMYVIINTKMGYMFNNYVVENKHLNIIKTNTIMYTICIFVSDIASLIGLNPYQCSKETTHNIICRHNGETIINEEQEYYENVNDELKEEIINAIDIETEEDSKEIINNIHENIEYKELQMIESIVRKERGIKKENMTLNKEVINRQMVVQRNIKTKYCNLKIYGKVDGMRKDGILIETKNRRNKLFTEIPLYEKVQLEMYMWCTNNNVIIHKQNYNNKSEEVLYQSNNDFLNKIIQGLKDWSGNICFRNNKISLKNTE